MMLLSRHNPVSLLDNAPLREMLEKNLDFERIQGNIDAGALYAVCVTASGYTSGQSVSFFQGGSGLEGWERNQRIGAAVPLNLDLLLASAALPFIFPAVKFNREYFGDGSMRQIAPVSPALHLGADRVLIVGTGRQTRRRGARALQRLSVARADRRPRAQQHLPRQPDGRHRAPRAHQPHRAADPAGQAGRLRRRSCGR